MKNVSEILKNLQSQPQFSKLSHFGCIKKITSLFSPPLQKMVKFAYIKNETLFFVLNHPGAKQEFDNNIQSIKSALNYITPPECQETNFKNIKAFVTHTPLRQSPKPKSTKEHYKERASGTLEVNIQDEKLNKLVQSIFDIIKSYNGS